MRYIYMRLESKDMMWCALYLLASFSGISSNTSKLAKSEALLSFFSFLRLWSNKKANERTMGKHIKKT